MLWSTRRTVRPNAPREASSSSSWVDPRLSVAERTQVHDHGVALCEQLAHRGSPRVVETEELVDPVAGVPVGPYLEAPYPLGEVFGAADEESPRPSAHEGEEFIRLDVVHGQVRPTDHQDRAEITPPGRDLVEQTLTCWVG